MEKGFSGDIIKKLNLKPDKVIDLIKKNETLFRTL